MRGIVLSKSSTGGSSSRVVPSISHTLMPPFAGAHASTLDCSGGDSGVGFVGLSLQDDGSLDLGTPSGFSSVDNVTRSFLGDTNSMGLPKVVEWSLDSRDGRRVAVSGLNPEVFCPPFGKIVGESMGEEQELIGTSLLAGSDAGLILANCSGVEVPSSDLVLYPVEDSRDSGPLNVHPLVVLEEPVLPLSEASNWVVQKIKSYRCVVRPSCDGFEDDLMALLTAIRASRDQNRPTHPNSPPKLANRRH